MSIEPSLDTIGLSIVAEQFHNFKKRDVMHEGLRLEISLGIITQAQIGM